MKELIRKILKESTDEFDWVDTNPNSYESGQGLYNLIQDFLKLKTNGKYFLERYKDSIELSDDTGIYYTYRSMEDFTISQIVADFEGTLYRDLGSVTTVQYRQLAKVLEPIIGPIN